MSTTSIWLPESDKLADYIAQHCIDQRDDGGYWFHHAKATAAIDRVLRIAMGEKPQTIPRPSTGHPAQKHRCNICGGIVQYDATAPQPSEGWKMNTEQQLAAVIVGALLPKYRVTTYDVNTGKFTPQSGVRCAPYSKWGLRKALRKLRRLGYEATRSDSSVLVERIEP
jgi:hypothetical protein